MSAQAFEIKETYMDSLPVRHDESGAEYWRRLAKVQEAGTFLRLAVQIGRPQREIDAITETIDRLTKP